MEQITLSSSYVDWPFAGFDIDGADHLDDGTKSIITANRALHRSRIRLLRKYGLDENGVDLEADAVDSL